MENESTKEMCVWERENFKEKVIQGDLTSWSSYSSIRVSTSKIHRVAWYYPCNLTFTVFAESFKASQCQRLTLFGKFIIASHISEGKHNPFWKSDFNARSLIQIGSRFQKTTNKGLKLDKFCRLDSDFVQADPSDEQWALWWISNMVFGFKLFGRSFLFFYFHFANFLTLRSSVYNTTSELGNEARLGAV